MANTRFDHCGMPADAVCEREMFVNIVWQERLLAAPLAPLPGLVVVEEAEQTIQDWRTWVDRGYVLQGLRTSRMWRRSKSYPSTLNSPTTLMYVASEVSLGRNA